MINMRDPREEVDVRAEVPVSVTSGDDAYLTDNAARRQPAHSYVIMPPPQQVSSNGSYADGAPSSLEEVVRFVFLFFFLLVRNHALAQPRRGVPTNESERETRSG